MCIFLIPQEAKKRRQEEVVEQRLQEEQYRMKQKERERERRVRNNCDHPPQSQKLGKEHMYTYMYHSWYDEQAPMHTCPGENNSWYLRSEL